MYGEQDNLCTMQSSSLCTRAFETKVLGTEDRFLFQKFAACHALHVKIPCQSPPDQNIDATQFAGPNPALWPL